MGWKWCYRPRVCFRVRHQNPTGAAPILRCHRRGRLRAVPSMPLGANNQWCSPECCIKEGSEPCGVATCSGRAYGPGDVSRDIPPEVVFQTWIEIEITPGRSKP